MKPKRIEGDDSEKQREDGEVERTRTTNLHRSSSAVLSNHLCFTTSLYNHAPISNKLDTRTNKTTC